MTAHPSGDGDLVCLAVIVEGGGERRDLFVETSSDCPAREVVDALAAALAFDDGSAAYSPRLGRVLGDAEPFVDWVQQGDRLVISDSLPAAAPRPPGTRELVVVGGALAGRRYALAEAEQVLGRDAGCALTLDDPTLSRAHVRIRSTNGAVEIGDAGSRNGTAVDGRRVEPGEERRLSEGELIRAGRTLFTIRARPADPPAHHDARVGFIGFNRTMRVVPKLAALKRRIPAPPDDQSRYGRVGLLASLPFALIGVVLWRVTGSVMMLLFVAVTPLMALMSFVEERTSRKRGLARGRQKYRRTLVDLRAELDRAWKGEIAYRRRAAPAAPELLDRAQQHLDSLWERGRNDHDFAELRLGSADRPSVAELVLEEGGSEALRVEAERLLQAYATVPAVPVTVPVAEIGTLGICGAPDSVAALARFLVLQAATLHSPRDLVVAAAVEPGGWDWLKWLPHTWEHRGPRAGSLGPNRVSAREVVQSILTIRAERHAELRDFLSTQKAVFTPFVLLVIDEQSAPESSLVAKLLEDAARYGIGVLWLGSERRAVPGGCGAVVELDDRSGTLTYRDARTIGDVLVDGIDPGLASQWALALAPHRDVTATAAGGGIPDRVGLADLLAGDLSAEDIADRWRAPPPGLAAPIGAAAEGPFCVDLRADGPHALVAGITGAGKSELLQTLIAALAVTYPPTRLSFLFIDYKGGLAFQECVKLPHKVGFVTDLDEHLTQRALASLRAELRRRETLLREAEANDLPELERRDPDLAPPSLVIVIDEFAGLAEELPEFIEGVVDVARRGRSLGVHLILATQRPGGVVSAQIRANTNLRIALRVNEPGESAEIIGVSDAVQIPRSLPGRAYALTGHGDLTEFQAGYSGMATTLDGAAREPVVREFGFGVESARAGARAEPAGETTDLQRLVAASRAAAEDLGLPAPRSPWLEPLPAIVRLETLPEPEVENADPGAVATVGLFDEPALQRRRPFAVDLGAEGSLLIFGAGGSGKSTLLRTLAISLAQRSSPDELQVYALDFATRALAALEALPHCGHVIPADDEERVERLLAQLRITLEARKELFARQGVFTLSDYRAAGGKGEPRILVLLDGYGGFSDAFFNVRGGELLDAFARLVADGRPLGVHFAISSDRRGAVPNALAAIIPTKVVLRMADEDEFVALGVNAKTVRRAVLPPGRGFVGGLELQCAIPGDDPSAEGQIKALEDAAAQLRRRWGNAEAPEVRLLPMQVGRSELARRPTRPLEAAIGIANTSLQPISIDLDQRHFLVVGPNRSGRTTALRVIAESLRESSPGLAMHLLAPRKSELAGLDLWASVAVGVEECAAAAERHSELVLGDADEPVVVVVDDLDELDNTAAALPLQTVVHRGRDRRLRVVAAVERATALSFSQLLDQLRREKHGLLLDPNLLSDGDVFGVQLPRRANMSFPPGRGFLVDRGAFELVQVGLPDS